MAARDDATAEDQRIKFRVGINSGDVIVEDGDIHSALRPWVFSTQSPLAAVDEAAAGAPETR
jgi:class 3 adenylate cyclase